jgi:metal-responsive CopG/Arc/MetJ family transcriptional regulator
MAVSISITLDDELGEELNAAVAGGNRSAFVAEAVRDSLDRRAVSAADDWHASLTDEDAVVFAEFNSAW